jgi:MFS family permease
MTVGTEPLTPQARSRILSLDYLLFLFGQILSGSGTWIYRAALVFILIEDGRSGLVLGTVTGAGMVSLALLTPYASGVADRHDALTLAWSLNAALGVIFIAFFTAYEFVGANLVLILAMVLLAGTASAFEAPARQRLLPELVGLEEWSRAVVATGVVYNISRFAGPLAAIAAIAALGPGMCIALNGVSFLVAAATLFRVRRSSLATLPKKETDKHGWVAAMRTCMSRPAFAVPVVAFLLVSLVAINDQATVPLLSADLYGTSSERLSAMLAALAGGALAAGLVLLKYRKLGNRAFNGAVLALAVTNGVMLVHGGWVTVLATCFALGAAIGAITSIANVVIQMNAPIEYRARAFATFYVLSFGTTAIGAPLSGELVDIAGARSPFAVSMVICLLAWAWFFVMTVRRPSEHRE